MIELLLNISGYIIVAAIILVTIVALPSLVVLLTESDNQPNHVYAIFKEEMGFRGQKILSAAGCLVPFIELSKTSNELEGILIASCIGIICAWYHSSVYKTYPVFDKNLKVALAVVLTSLILVGVLTRQGFISSGVFTFILFWCGIAWGGYAVYKRSKLIRITRLS